MYRCVIIFVCSHIGLITVAVLVELPSCASQPAARCVCEQRCCVLCLTVQVARHTKAERRARGRNRRPRRSTAERARAPGRRLPAIQGHRDSHAGVRSQVARDAVLRTAAQLL